MVLAVQQRHVQQPEHGVAALQPDMDDARRSLTSTCLCPASRSSTTRSGFWSRTPASLSHTTCRNCYRTTATSPAVRACSAAAPRSGNTDNSVYDTFLSGYSGQDKMAQKYGYFYTYEQTPRAQFACIASSCGLTPDRIFRRNLGAVEE